MYSPQNAYLDMDLLRFITAGSVDDGKSTLIGRLLFDSKAIFHDQLEALERASLMQGSDGINLAFLTDGLRAEREQGITIDVAYRYFHTPKRKFIIADTPGHTEYTRNMVTGASTANAAILLVDARKGAVEQTLRHAYIASLLRIPHITVCVNKMYFVGYNRDTFEGIKSKFLGFATSIDVQDIEFIPISALNGDNVVIRSTHMPWYEGPTLMTLLENLHMSNSYNHSEARFPVQLVIRPNSGEYPDYIGYAGRMASGTFQKGERVMVLPSGFTSTIKSIDLSGESLESCTAPQSVTLTLAHNIDVSRGCMIVPAENGIQVSNSIDIMICWLSEKPMALGTQYALMHTTNQVHCTITGVKFKIDTATLTRNYSDKAIHLNDIACISIRTTQPILFDTYQRNRVTGSLIIIDEVTNATIGAGMIQ